MSVNSTPSFSPPCIDHDTLFVHLLDVSQPALTFTPRRLALPLSPGASAVVHTLDPEFSLPGSSHSNADAREPFVLCSNIRFCSSKSASVEASWKQGCRFERFTVAEGFFSKATCICCTLVQQSYRL